MITLNVKPLSVNACFQGRRFKNKNYKNYENEIYWLLKQNYMYSKFTGYIYIHYKFYLKNWKKTDGGNLEKCLTDILVSNKVIEDDRFIMKYVIEKFPADKDYIEIEIDEVEKIIKSKYEITGIKL